MEEAKKQFEIMSPYRVDSFYRFTFPPEKVKQHNFVFQNPIIHCQVKLSKHPDRLNLPFTLEDSIKTVMHCFCYDVKEDYGHCNILRFRIDLLNHYDDEGTIPQVKSMLFGDPMVFEEQAIKEGVEKLQKSDNAFLQSIDSSKTLDLIITAVLAGCECPVCVHEWNKAKALYDEKQAKAEDKSLTTLLEELGDVQNMEEE
jgi:hypothetical protein